MPERSQLGPLTDVLQLAAQNDVTAKEEQAMRRILVDHARSKQSQKRGGKAEKLELSSAFLVAEQRSEELISVHEALNELEIHDAQAAELVKLRYFVGMKHGEAASVMGISRRTADRLWSVAKAWLYRALRSNE